MKRLRFLTVLGISLVAGQAAIASESLSDFPMRTLPVLVNVDSSGKITSASPALDLPPVMARLLRTNLDEMVSGPAHWKGKPVSSQCIINVALKASPRDDGKYDAGFAYLSAQPVPIGRWHWVNLDGRRLMLANDDWPRRSPFQGRMGPDPSSFRGTYQRNVPMPAMAPTPQPAAASPGMAPARGR